MRLALTLLILLALSGCSTLGYYGQSVAGHFALMSSSRPIDAVVEDPRVAKELRETLRHVEAMRLFATNELGLPDNGSYRQYTALDREAVVWSLVATGEFSLEPQTWCYPVIGCAGYRGYFSRKAARAAATLFETEGRDVAVNPVPAYSTLGWFPDPLPSTVAGWPLFRIAELIFHELAHQRLYVSDDSSFNEGFATAVARYGVERWLSGPESLAERREWHLRKERKQGFNALIKEASERLDALYKVELSDRVKRDRKASEFRRLKGQYRILKRAWGDYRGYDRWFDQPLNNAYIASVVTYESSAPAFEHLLRRLDGDMRRFYLACEKLAEMSPPRRKAALDRLLEDESALPLELRADAS